MLSVISQMPLCALIVGLLGLYIGYLLGKASCDSLKHLEEECHH